MRPSKHQTSFQIPQVELSQNKPSKASTVPSITSLHSSFVLWLAWAKEKMRLVKASEIEQLPISVMGEVGSVQASCMCSKMFFPRSRRNLSLILSLLARLTDANQAKYNKGNLGYRNVSHLVFARTSAKLILLKSFSGIDDILCDYWAICQCILGMV